MRRAPILILTCTIAAAAMILTGAERPSALAQAQPGLWEISGAPGTSSPVRQCVSEIALLARFEHRANACSAKVLKDAASSTAIDYECGGAGFGHSEIDVITPRALRISTQGISGGLPFNYVLQARRVDDCSKPPAPTHH